MGCPTPIGPRPRFIPAVNVAQVAMRYSLAGQEVENVYHVQGTSPWTVTTLGALGTYFENWENTHMAATRGDSTQLHEVLTVDLTVVDGGLVVSSITIDGTDTAEQLPNNVTIAIKHQTDTRGRSFRGRTYHVGLTQDMRSSVDVNRLDPAMATTILTRMTFLLTTAMPNGGKLVVLSYANDCTWRAAAVATIVTGFSFTDTVFDSQRRRLPAHNVHH